MSDHNFTKRSDNPAQSAADGPHRARVSQQDVNPSRSTLRARLLAGVAAIALTAGAIATHQSFGIEDAWAANTTPQSAILAQRNAAKTGSMPDFVDLVQALKPAVVSVRVKANLQPQLSMMQGENPFKGTPFEKFFRQFGDEATPGSGNMLKPHLARAQGSAFFITPDGYLVTNNHVIDKAVEVEITMDDGTTMPAKVVGADPKTDIALLKVSGREDFPYVKLSDTTPPIGSWVVAMGNPFGLGGTVTAGIVSAKGRDIGNGPYDDFIQIDAPVNSGNSGGPTFDMNGEAIGVNTAIFSPSGGNVGIAFDIPAPVVKQVVAQLREKGHVERGWLGVQVQPVTSAIADSLGLKTAHGALISSPQTDSPAAKAGLKSGDIITKVDDKEIKDARDLARTIAGLNPGRSVTLTLLRAGKSETRTVELGELKSKPQTLASAGNAEDDLNQLGLKVAPASSVEGAGEEGLAVLAVDADGAAADVGIQSGDVIKKVGNRKISTVGDLKAALGDAKQNGRKHTLALVHHDNSDRYVALPVG
ncbi:MAG TPA: Do family serine endopeptidase [Hyphomicrobiaceae bacterium]|nr:Do family serine endopeptidase [Hyphomicrobiaceae bacterium]